MFSIVHSYAVSQQLNSNKKDRHPPSQSPFTRRLGQQLQVIPNLKEHMQWKSMEDQNEIQIDFSGSKINPKEEQLKGR